MTLAASLPWFIRTRSVFQSAPSPETRADEGRTHAPAGSVPPVAAVSDTVAEQRSAALLDGQRVVGFEIVRSRGAGEVDVALLTYTALARTRIPSCGPSGPGSSTASAAPSSKTATTAC